MYTSRRLSPDDRALRRVPPTNHGQQARSMAPAAPTPSPTQRLLHPFSLRLGARWNWLGRGLAFALIFILAGCGGSTQTLGPRPALDLATVVEAYLQQYQPGPLPRVFQTTYVYDRNGTLLAELFEEGRRTWVKLDQISPHLIDATVATEDATFFTNTGIDPVRIAGAALQNLEEGEVVSGASTITMQLARNLFLGPDERYDQKFDRKIVEAGLARELTDKYTKEEILEMYLNLLNYGHLAYGPEAAAQVYFGKSASELTLAEAALLAGIPQQPANLDLFRNFEAAKERQRVVLSLMVRHGFLSQAQADAAFAAPIALNPAPDLQTVRAPHFVNYVLAEMEERLGEEFVRRAGLRIHTTLDLELQQLAQEIVRAKVEELAPRYDMNNAALVALRPGAGEVLAMVGSVNFFDQSIQGQVNVAASPRQPGSSIKPILYATALSDNLISPATVIWDTPVTYTVGVGQIYKPLNYDRKFHGPVTARAALANSFNVPAVKLLAAVGVPRMLESARAMGLKSLNRGPEWYGLSLTLGGGEVTLIDLATAYHTLANQGRSVPAQTVLTITDSQGQTLNEDPPTPGVQAISPAAAYLITDMLSDNPARTPMFGSRSPLVLSRPAAAKTGTTDDNRDAWTMGYTRYLLAGVWTGNTDGRPMQRATGASAAAPIWNAFMEAVLNDPALLARINAPTDPAAWNFPRPEEVPDVQLVDACPPGLTCRQGGGEVFSQAWLEATGERGPLADSVLETPSAPVYGKNNDANQLVGFCAYQEGATRRLLRLPGAFGPPTDEERPDLVLVAADVNLNDAQTAERLAEQRAALQWSLEHNTSVYLGPCEELEALAQAMGVVLAVDLAHAGEPTPPEIAEGGLVEVGSPILTGDFVYVLNQPVWHDADCPGGYIVGRVINRSGAPVAGVHIVLFDQWGNRYDAVTKNGPADYGHFDFPIYSATPQTLRLMVVDGGGTPISPEIPIPHNMDEASNHPCHHVVLVGG